ncbi:MAG: ADP-ribosylglycohydrolase family protein [FCB group bacterium]|jgi:ADP-ribosylglycohydrolase|nr:ADP-ribosylglycohydrolase family protein [FCB group bacterium]
MSMRQWGLLAVGLGVVLVSSGCATRQNSAWRHEGIKLTKDQATYTDKVNGAWSGKLIGLIAGQPTEGFGKEEIERRATAVNSYPLNGYMPPNFDTPHKGFLAGNFTCSPPNDDSDLMLTSFLTLRERGVDFTPKDLAEMWVKYVPGACTAELIALENFRKGIWPPESAVVDNPYQEMIGAQMRGDIWGMIAPGMPTVAAEYATRDASITHTGNGIYGEQYIAAAVSLAFVEKDPRKIIEGALQVIPADSAYAQAIRDAIAYHDANPDWQDAWKELDKKWGFLPNGKRDAPFADARYNTNQAPYLWADIKWVYADVNGAAIVLAMLYGEGDFSKSVNLAVMLGYDNDCNAGTVAAILGAMNGAGAIPESWIGPLNDTYQTTLNLPDKEVKISDLARETVTYGRQVMKTR